MVNETFGKLKKFFISMQQYNIIIGLAAKKMWVNLLDRYHRYLGEFKNIPTGTGAAEVKQHRWWLFPIMHGFLVENHKAEENEK